MLRWGQKITTGATFGTLVRTHRPPRDMGHGRVEENAPIRLILLRGMARISERDSTSIVDIESSGCWLEEIGSEPSSLYHPQLFDLSVCILTYLYYMSAFSLKGWRGRAEEFAFPLFELRLKIHCHCHEGTLWRCASRLRVVLHIFHLKSRSQNPK